MAALGGLLELAITELREAMLRPQNTKQLLADNALFKLSHGFKNVLTDINTTSEKELELYMDYTLSGIAGDYRFTLPAMCGTVKFVVGLDSSGNVLGHVRHLREYDVTMYRYGYRLEGPYLRLIRPTEDTSVATLRVVYEPTGYVPLHYGTLNTATVGAVDTTDGLYVAPNIHATITAGHKDYRPNAYVGAYFHTYETSSAPTGYTDTTYNQQQTLCTDFTETTQRITVSPALPFASLASKGGTWKYEIVPSLDWSVWHAAVLWTARSQALRHDRRHAMTLNDEYQTVIRGVRLEFSTADAVWADAYDRRQIRAWLWC